MTRELPTQAANLFSTYRSEQSKQRTQVAEDLTRKSKVQDIFRRGEHLAAEYPNKGPYFNTIRHDGKLVDVVEVVTHPASLQVNGNTEHVVVVAQVFALSNQLPRAPIDKYSFISVYPSTGDGDIIHYSDSFGEGTGTIHSTAGPIFRIALTDTLQTQNNQDNDPVVIQATLEFMGAIEQELQGTQTPLSQKPQPQPTTAKRAFNTLTTIIKRLNS